MINSQLPQLFVGNQNILIEQTEKILKTNFCKNKDNLQNQETCFCSECKKIKNNQHESVVWLNPEKDYSVKDIEIIFEKIKFSLDENKNFFFILQKAQDLNLSCANRLLKVLEEPPIGYNFILHTNNINLILPTIISRCHVVNFINLNTTGQQEQANTLLSFFYNQRLNSPIDFEKELKNQSLTDSQSIELLNQMLSFYATKIIDSHKNNTCPQYYYDIFDFLKNQIKKPPQSGSSAVFWKNLYLSFPGPRSP